MEDDWDLHAVVRGCCTSVVVSATTGPSFAASSTTIDPLHFHLPYPLGSSDLLEQRTSSFEEELHELCKPFFSKPDESLLFQSPAAISAFRGKDPSLLTQPLLTQPLLPQLKPSFVASQAPRSKRRKNQFKKVCQVPAESISSDIWAWRKYGQKPIKGSPYPRGYYRCSSSKGCLARKQVERNRSDPGLFIVTYTAEHNHPVPTHRNSLAGSTRPKPATTPSGDPSSSSAAVSSPSAGKIPSSISPANSLEGEALPQSTSRGDYEDDGMDNDEEDDADVALSDMAVNDDFFVGLEGLLDGDSSNEDGFLDLFPANFGLSWNAGSTAAAAGRS